MVSNEGEIVATIETINGDIMDVEEIFADSKKSRSAPRKSSYTEN